MTALRSLVRQSAAGLRLLLAFTVILGLVYPVAIWAVGRVVPDRSGGSFVEGPDGTVVGSSLIGQPFEEDEWFLPRPSASGYDPLATGGSNLGPNNEELVAAIEAYRAEVAEREGVDPADVPPDAVTASWSALDPHISPEYAWLQVSRVAQARDLSEEDVAALVEDRVEGRQLGFLGEERVNVLELNLDLAQLDG